MKHTISFLILILSLLLASALLLTGCIYVIAGHNGESKPYHIEDIDLGKSIEDSPTAQAALQAKFETFLHEEDEGKTVIVFSDEQYRALKLQRLGGERSALTYDEILFLINDSIHLYFGHDRVVLTNAVADGISEKLYLSSNAEVIDTYHGDFTEFDDNTLACQKYGQMIRDIYSIIYYRIYMHDAGFRRVSELYYHIPSTCLAELKVCAEGSWYESAKDNELVNVMQMLSIDGGNSTGSDYREKLENEYQSYTGKLAHMRPDANSIQFLTNTLESPLLLTYRRIDGRTNSAPSFFLVDTDAFTTTQLYPTEELKALYPGISRMYTVTTAFGFGFSRPVFVLNEADNSFYLCENVMLSSYGISGSYEETDGKLTLWPKDVDNSDAAYMYVFYEKNGVYAYEATESFPVEALTFEAYLEFHLNSDPFSFGE